MNDHGYDREPPDLCPKCHKRQTAGDCKCDDLFAVLTRLEFDDRVEGQILHIGDNESSETVLNSIWAISYAGDATAIRKSSIHMVPTKPGELTVGKVYGLSKEPCP